MKIFNVMFSKVNGGLEQVFLNYNTTLEAQGNQVIPIIHPHAEIRHDCSSVHLKTVHNFNQYDFIAIWKLRQLIRKERPDCIITHSYRAAYLLKKTWTKVPKIAVCHVQGHYRFGADAFIALTDSMRQDIISSGIPAHQVFVVPNMITTTPTTRSQENTIPVIGACARFVSMKGIDIFLTALRELKKRRVLFQAKIAGDGPEKEYYQRLIEQYHLQAEVQLLGWVTQRDDFYNSLDIFCLPSRKEAFGLVILESMAHSLPQVLSRLPGPLEIINESNSALFCPPENPSLLADNLEKLIHDKALRQQLGLNARQRAEDYSVAQVGPKLHQTLVKICATYNQKMDCE